ncbi:MAG: hypothetical protein HYT11_01935, partial [Candidatus Levybacteria bacterium]|nr:hypothetical protein [Candidatus Levybacteria bacterium]
MRFVSDPDFVTDWIGYLLELQFGMAVIVGTLAGRLPASNVVQSSKFKIQSDNAKFKIFNFKLQFLTLNFAFLICLTILIFIGLDAWLITRLTGNVKYQSKIISILINVPPNERIFLSGTPVFWINAYLDQAQI